MTPQPQERKRGGCFTLFLVLMLITNPLTGLLYVLAGSIILQALPNVPSWAILLLTALAFVNFVFALAIWKWKKWGVYGFAGSSLVIFVINTLTLGLVGGLLGLVSLALLAFLARPVWNALEGNRIDTWVLASRKRTALVITVFLGLLTVAGIAGHFVLGLNVYDPVAAQQAAAQGDKKSFLDSDKKIVDYTTAISLDPKNAKYYLLRGNVYDIKAFSDKGSRDLAIADYTRAIELTNLAPKSSFGLPMPPNQFTSLLYDDRGKDYYAQGSFDQAIADFNRAIQVDPTYDFPYIDRGVAYREHGDYDLAIADFTKDIGFEPTYGPSYYNRGMAFQRKGDKAQAIADFQKYLEYSPSGSNRDQVQQWIDQLK